MKISQSSMIEDDEEELSMVPGVDEEGANEKMANGDRIAHAADDVLITKGEEKILAINHGVPMSEVPEVVTWDAESLKLGSLCEVALLDHRLPCKKNFSFSLVLQAPLD